MEPMAKGARRQRQKNSLGKKKEKKLDRPCRFIRASFKQERKEDPGWGLGKHTYIQICTNDAPPPPFFFFQTPYTKKKKLQVLGQHMPSMSSM